MSKEEKEQIEKDIARAQELSKEEFRNLDRVKKNLVHKFKNTCPLHDMCLLPGSGLHDFELTVFFETDLDIEQCRRYGIVQQISDELYHQLELAGRGSRAENTARFEWDSHENVIRKYGGDYFLRLR